MAARRKTGSNPSTNRSGSSGGSTSRPATAAAGSMRLPACKRGSAPLEVRPATAALYVGGRRGSRGSRGHGDKGGALGGGKGGARGSGKGGARGGVKGSSRKFDQRKDWRCQDVPIRGSFPAPMSKIAAVSQLGMNAPAYTVVRQSVIREADRRERIIAARRERNKSPGPWHYSVKSTVGKGPQCSIGKRLRQRPDKIDIPGPQSYNLSKPINLKRGPAWSFGTAVPHRPRLKKKVAPISPASYMLPSTLRQSSMTFGARIDLPPVGAKKEAGPGPAGYYPKGNHERQGKIGFALKGKLSRKNSMEDIPGPGSYSPSRSAKPSFIRTTTLGARIADPSLSEHNQGPDPGAYSLPVALARAGSVVNLHHQAEDNEQELEVVGDEVL